ncbi:MAG TPA: metal ABC transporter substrate-binding protein [Accumulibacter sp.]|jgi:zinc/manganese transport system substrate-binding protein|nr:metal ABC transporter substrate-binding protein [Accumulibacter sp.]HQC80208.1 metal ABC transporter substrate-binding protein [Accumulibacter sp.]
MRATFPAIVRRRLTAFVVLLLAASFAGAGEPLPVVASFSILGDLAQRIGGDRVKVYTLVGAGADAHVYQPSPADARTLSHARLAIVNGLGFEGWIERLIQSSGYRGKLVVASQGIAPLKRPAATARNGNDPADIPDPHAWQDLTNARRYVDNIAAALDEADPANKAIYRANAARLNQEISALDREIRATFDALPAERRKVVSSHDAFAYFGNAYGIRFIAPVGVSTDAEPSAAGIGAIIRQIRREKITAMFVENIADPRLLERISRESGARLGGTLYADALAPAGKPADSYLGMMRHNARTLAGALTTAPAN